MLSYWDRKINRKLEPFFRFIAPAAPVFHAVAIGLTVVFILGLTAHFGYWIVPQPELPTASQTYVSERYGFSFKYSPDFKVEDVSPDDSGFIAVMPVLQATGTLQAIVISPRLIYPSESAVDWLYGPYSGYDASRGHMVRYVGGQYAASVEGGSWVVFNSPYDDERVSIALLGKDGPVPLRREMETILTTFSFDITLDPENLQCPSYYLTSDAKGQAIKAFLNTLSSTTDEAVVVPARIDFYISHDCTDMLEQYGYNGDGSVNLSERKQLIKNMLESLKNTQ